MAEERKAVGMVGKEEHSMWGKEVGMGEGSILVLDMVRNMQERKDHNNCCSLRAR